jgi:hypothetical protein
MVIPSLIGLIGGLVGALSGLLALWDRWKNRKPRFILFAPYNFTGQDAETRRRVLFVYLRIANLSKNRAFLYLETMSVEIKSSGKWHKAVVGNTDSKTPFETDFPEFDKVRFGLHDVKFINRFDETIVDCDAPLCGYIPLIYKDEDIIHPEGIRIKVKDCHLKSYTMEVDFAEQQRKHDPDYQPKN